jgi:hypothetical protein
LVVRGWGRGAESVDETGRRDRLGHAVIELRDDIVDLTDPAAAPEHRFVAVVRCQAGFVASCICGWHATAVDIAKGVDALEAHVASPSAVPAPR